MARFLFVVGLITTGLALAGTSAAQEVPNADLAVVSNTASVKRAKVGNEVTFTIVATNHGPDAAELDVTWSSEQMQLVSETCDRGISADTPTCEYGFVKPGHSRWTTVAGSSAPATRTPLVRRVSSSRRGLLTIPTPGITARPRD
jgi:uncharacterized repeat protein (TIGR01451 family)